MATRIDWHQVATTTLGIVAGTVASLGTVAVAVAGFTLSFDAIRAVAVAAHVRPSWAWLMPLSVDGAMSVATVAAVVLRRLGRRPAYPWLVVLSGAAISIACNALHARGGHPLGERAAMAVSAIPPVMLALSVHLLVVLAVAVADRVTATVGAASPEMALAAQAPPVSVAEVADRRDETASGDDEADAAEDASHAVAPTAQWRPTVALAAVPTLSGAGAHHPVGGRHAGTHGDLADRRSTADIVADLHRRHPDATAEQIAEMAGRSVRTVERYLPAARRARQMTATTHDRINGTAVAASN